MDPIRWTEMIVGGPLIEALAELKAELAELRELASGSHAHVVLARQEKRFEAALERARLESPTCGSDEAADILDVTPRQATKLAQAGVIQAEQRVPGGPWTFSVRSCHAYAARRSGRRAS